MSKIFFHEHTCPYIDLAIKKFEDSIYNTDGFIIAKIGSKSYHIESLNSLDNEIKEQLKNRLWRINISIIENLIPNAGEHIEIDPKFGRLAIAKIFKSKIFYIISFNNLRFSVLNANEIIPKLNEQMEIRGYCVRFIEDSETTKNE